MSAVSALLSLLVSACAGRQSALDPAGLQAARLSRLWWFMFWVCSAVFVLVMVATIQALRRGRDRSRKAAAGDGETRPELEQDPERERRLTRVIGGATGVTVLLLFAMLLFDFSTGRALLSLAAADEPLTVEVIGHQWWWSVKYDDPVPSRIVETANEIHLPLGRPVQFKLTSIDVIHSFWVPNLHGKKDMIPGQQTITWLQADRPGVYRGQCAEFCGYQHAKMALVVIVEPEEEFQAWLDGQRVSSAAPASEEEKRGQQVFLSSSCVMCHAIRGTPAGGRFGPDLTHLASRRTIAAGALPMTRDHLGRWVTDSQEVKPGNRMPPVPLAADRLQDLLSYLESLK